VAFNWRGLVKDKKLLAFGGAGAGLGLLVYLRRKRQAGAGAGVDTGQPVQPGTADSGAVDAYNNLQSELENLQGQITALYGGAPLPTAQQGVAPKPKPGPGPTPAPKSTQRYVSTSRLGGSGGHPVSYAWLQGIGAIRQVGGKYVATGKFGLQSGHPIDYAFLSGSGLIRKV
jgi:hypothetical protein